MNRFCTSFMTSDYPQDAYTAGRLQGWLKRHPQAEAGLRMKREDLVARDPGANLAEQFPDHLDWEDVQFRLSYQFEPGGAADGVSVTVPVALLNRVPQVPFRLAGAGTAARKMHPAGQGAAQGQAQTTCAGARPRGPGPGATRARQCGSAGGPVATAWQRWRAQAVPRGTGPWTSSMITIG